MFTLLGPRRVCRGTVSRRDVLKLGTLAFGGLALPELLQRQAKAGNAAGSAAGRGKSVIMIWLRGGPSHIDSFDMKPAAPPEIRGEFSPIATNVPGIEVCEHLPRHAQMMDKLAIVRGIRSNDLGDHTPHYILTGFPDRGKRPAFGSIVSRLQPRRDGLPPFVSTYQSDYQSPTYLGPAHRPFIPKGEGLANMSLLGEISRPRLEDRKELLASLDTLRRKMDTGGTFAGIDSFNAQAIQMITSPKAREAFNLNKEPPESLARYGKYCEGLLLARRLVEGGVNVVSLKIGDWDTHEHNFRDMREQLPQLDQGFSALVDDLHQRGLDRDVAVVVWGEFGRAPRISRIAGRDHWPEAGAAVLAGGGFKTGQVIGQTDRQAGQSIGNPYTPANVLATLYRHLGIDPAQTLADHNNRPMHVLDDRDVVSELL